MKKVALLLLSGFMLLGLTTVVQRQFDEHTVQAGRQPVMNEGNYDDRQEIAPQIMPRDHHRHGPESDSDNGSVRETLQEETSSPNRGPGIPLFDFGGREPTWYTVNDDVMGGVSNSLVVVDTELQTLSFSGNVSLDNNGGFASTRSQWANYDLSTFDGIALRVRGDGNTYRFRIRTEETGFGIAYTSLFTTKADTWQEVYIPFSEMVPLYRGFLVNAAGPLKPESIRSFGLMLADKQAGEFSLDVDWINAVAERQEEIRYARTSTEYEQRFDRISLNTQVLSAN